MYVFKRGDIWWYDFTVRGERFRGSTGARLKEDALTIEKREHRKAFLGGLHQSLTLEEAADIWFAAKVVGKKSASNTAQRVVIMLRHMDRRLPIGEIGARHITAAMNARQVEPIRRGKNGPQVITLLPEDAVDMRARAGRARSADLDTVWFREMKSGELRAIAPRGFQSAAATASSAQGLKMRARCMTAVTTQER